MRLILASSSPRRRELLAQAGYAFAVEAADVDESPRAGEAAGEYVRRLAEEKARAVFLRNSMRPGLAEEAPVVVLGADTTVVCDGEILAKPTDPEDAKRMLQRLSGRSHEVLTGVAVMTRAGVDSDVETTVVTFRLIAEDELEIYCASAEPMDKAGAYGIQGYAARWIPRVEGCYFNVMGLPIARVVRMLSAAMSGSSDS